MKNLDRLLRPKSIAVFGASWAYNVIEQCQKMGFSGPVWPIHPIKTEVCGLKAYPSLADLPHAPDATFIGVNRFATVDVVAQLSSMGAGGAICFASGWTEAGEPELQSKLITAAGQMPILGPNCYGVINYLDGALLWPDQHGGVRVDKGVALLSQSSNIIINMSMQRRALPIAYIACLGNAAVVGLADLAGALLADDRVTAIGMYIEGIDDAVAFAELAARARAAGKGIVCIKSGKTELSRTAAASHTASLAGGGAASSAFLRQIGVAEVNTPSELIETLKIMHVHGNIGTRLCSLSCSGGEAGLVADLASPFGIDFPSPSDATRLRLGEILGPIVTIANPLDYHTFIWGDGPRTTDVFATMLQGYDAGMFVIDPPRNDRCDPVGYKPALDAIIAAQNITGVPAFPIASIAENFDEAYAIDLMNKGVVTLMGLETGLAAIRAAQLLPPTPLGWLPVAPCLVVDANLLSEAEGKDILAKVGVAVPRAVSGLSLAEVQEKAVTLTAPLALKGLGFAHKTEAGAVRLGLASLMGQSEIQGASGYLVEEMVIGAVAEVLLGIRRDPIYGLSLTLGMGGVAAEVFADTITIILPATEADILDKLQNLRLWPLLNGFRGRPKADMAAVARIAVLLGELMIADDSFEEIEINPILVRQTGAIAVDALIRKA
jgi:acyl-CoA synthetase (NDP forming)